MWKYKVYKHIGKGIPVQLSREVVNTLRSNTTNTRAYTSSELPLRGLYIVITGTLWDTRSRIYNMIRDAGGYPQDRVDSITNLLVVGERPGNTKLNAAADRHISYITVDDFHRLINGYGDIDNMRRSTRDYVNNRIAGRIIYRGISR